MRVRVPRWPVSGQAHLYPMRKFVNDQLISTTRGLTITQSGDVLIETGFEPNDKVKDNATRYENFTVWSLNP